MLINQPKVRIATKRVTLWSGEAALAYFAVISVEGAVEVRFLGTKPLEETKPTMLMLAAPFVAAAVSTIVQTFTACVSPFFDTFDLLQNQLARAPSMN